MSYGPPLNSDPGPRPSQGALDEMFWALRGGAERAARLDEAAAQCRFVMYMLIGIPSAILFFSSYSVSLVCYGLSCAAVGWLSGWAVAFRTRLPDRGAKP